MTTPLEGVNDTDGFSLNGATDAFLNRWKDADEPSDAGKDDNTTDLQDEEDEDTLFSVDDDDNEGDDEDEESREDQSEDGNEPEDSPEATDDHKVTLTVDGETKTVTVKELKRLYGQEASLTRKSQEVAAARKAAEADGERYMLAAQTLLGKAQERCAPFDNIDWLVAQQRLTPDEFAALRAEAKEAYDDLNFLKNETDAVLTKVQTERQAARAEAARETIKVLERDIKGWNRELYTQVGQYAVDNGVSPEDFASIIDPAALKFIYKAMTFDRLKAKAADKKRSVPKAAPKRVVKPTSSRSQALTNAAKPRDKLASLAKTGSRDDAAAAFLERWADSND